MTDSFRFSPMTMWPAEFLARCTELFYRRLLSCQATEKGLHRRPARLSRRHRQTSITSLMLGLRLSRTANPACPYRIIDSWPK